MEHLVVFSDVMRALTACDTPPTNQQASSAPNVVNASEAASTPAPKVEVIKISSRELAKAYDENEAAADAKYKGKQLEVLGTIKMIDKGMMNEVNLQLTGKDDFSSVMATLSKEAESSAMNLKKKQKVTVVCTGEGEVMSMPILRECKIKK